MTKFISVHNVSKIYGTAQVLSGINMELLPGEVITLLGPNGAGKTTLSSIIASLHPPSSGDILYQGRSIYQDVASYRFKIGYCPQKATFQTGLTVKEQLYFTGRYYLMNPTAIRNQVDYLMEEFSLSAYANSYPVTLSGGYKQRLLLARALMHNPSLIILDEPTIALDPHIRRQLWNIILELKSKGVTILLTTHYLDEAEVLSDRVCVLDKGSIRLIDTPTNILTHYRSKNLEDVFLQLMNEDHTR